MVTVWEVFNFNFFTDDEFVLGMVGWGWEVFKIDFFTDDEFMLCVIGCDRMW